MRHETEADLLQSTPPFYANATGEFDFMKELLRLFAQITLLRRGPQDLPPSQLLLALTIAGYLAVNLLFGALLPQPSKLWIGQLAVDTVFTLAWYAVLMRLMKRPERFLQTATAVFGYQLLLAPLLLIAGFLVQRAVGPSAPATVQPGQWPALIMALILVVWMVAAGAHILKSALEWTMAAAVGLVILQVVAGQMLLIALFAS
jgi:hypothetical protein